MGIRTIIVGLDAFDPKIFERLFEQGRLPNLGRYVSNKAYAHLAVSNPPQSEVSWTSIATGLGPGEHGMFDFVHREPSNYAVFPSLLPTKKGIGGTQFVPPFTAKTLFDAAANQGYPATSLWWPATFPARPQSPVRTIPGLGTPDLLGRLGVGSVHSVDHSQAEDGGKIPIYGLRAVGKDRYEGAFRGPMVKEGRNLESTFSLEISGDQGARFKLGKQALEIKKGGWSPILRVSFKAGWFMKVEALTQVILTQIDPVPVLYALPLQIYPLRSPWRYGTPGKFVKQTWREAGPFLSLGWPQDTTALEEEHISDDQFLSLCEQIFAQRKRAFLYHLDQYHEGVLACVFDTLDRVQHMFLRDRPDVVEAWYEKLDKLVGEVEAQMAGRDLAKDTKLIILSDHGFAHFDKKVHLNRWLIEYGYLDAPGIDATPSIRSINWENSSAYAIGLNSIYLNLAGREGRGMVQESGKEALLQNLRADLLSWEGENNQPVVEVVQPGNEVFTGPLSAYGPDLFVGFAPGYRASQATGLGGWDVESLVANHDHWGADHCMHANAVPGVIFASHGLLDRLNQPSYRDIPYLATGTTPDAGSSAPPPISPGDGDEEAVEERLRSLGYL
jgi:predicted AlkP superfamily phosphohydrolase/phosphomutase